MGLEIKKGYKQTDVGLIPEDWEVKRFEEFGRFFKGKGIRKDEVKLEGNPCVRYGELYTRYDNIIKQTYSFINDLTANESIKIKYGDLLFAGSGETREEIGKSAVILRDDTYAGGDIVVFRPNKIDSVFLGFMSNSVPVSKQKSTNGQGDAVVHIYSGGISKVKIPLPPTLAEQKAIATALSDVDDLISSLDALIAKKKAIKQGAMQQLLTPPHKGGKRLDGFDGEWVEKKVSDVFSSVTDNRGKTPPYSKEDDIELIETASISFVSQSPDYSKVTKYVNKETYEKWFRQHPKEGDILISTVGEYSGNSAIMTSNRGTIAQNLIGFRPKNINPFFFFYWTRSDSYRTQLKKVMMGHAQPSLKVSWLIHFLIQFPIDPAEQKAIAQILSDMDKELEELATKKEKYEQIKQGMMQELLTGKTRLV